MEPKRTVTGQNVRCLYVYPLPANQGWQFFCRHLQIQPFKITLGTKLKRRRTQPQAKSPLPPLAHS